MLLPFIYLPTVYHVGNLSFTGDQIEPRFAPKNWDFECGLLSVSFDPQVWLGWAGARAAVYEIRKFTGEIRLLDVDQVIFAQRAAVQSTAFIEGLLVEEGRSLRATEKLYQALNLAFPPSTKRLSSSSCRS
jgi:hypothetical protein